MANLETLSDHHEIQNLIAGYCDALDSRDWDAMDDIFTPDALVDYSATGGMKGNFQEAKAYLDRALAQFKGSQHLVGLPVIKLDGDRATARTIVFNPMVIEHEGSEQVFFVGAWYIDTFTRTAEGWRICERREECSFFHNLPEHFQAVDPSN